jgi:hypothetical protein
MVVPAIGRDIAVLSASCCGHRRERHRDADRAAAGRQLADPLR